ncbi:MAG: cytochrome c biogenesis protein CcsA [Planctomycetes bacterium]|nr:cytochrome c biogenesis protein CcsA [Planctomycetota bacterium]
MNRSRATRRWSCAALLAVVVSGVPGVPGVAAPAPWPADVVARFDGLPVQAYGRVQPLRALARVRLLQASGRESVEVPDDARFGSLAGTRLGPTAWLLDVLLRPALANSYPVFVVDDARALELAGIGDVQRGRRARYAFDELWPGVARIEAAAASAARGGGGERLGRQLARLRDALRDHARLAGGLLLDGAAETGDGLAFVPPEVPGAAADWSDRSELASSRGDELARRVRERLAAVAAAQDEPTALRVAVAALVDTLRDAVPDPGLVASVDLELRLLRVAPFERAAWAFAVALLALLGGALGRRACWPGRAAALATGVGLMLLAWGIAVRSVLRGRPPVTTLYESVLLVTTGCVAAGAWLASRARRRGPPGAARLTLALSAGLGAVGALLAGRYESFLGTDTLAPLQAVLDADLWLSVHVTTVALGYVAGLFAGALGAVFVVLDALGRLRGDEVRRARARWLGAAIGGTLLVALALTTVGTILGGLWAQDAWGRFWGWDPKENGALAIVLWQLIAVHARSAGLCRERGIAVLAVLGNVVIAFAWWGVNLMGVGLHSYGFATGAADLLVAFCASQLALAVVAWVTALRDEAPGARQSTPSNPSP